MATRPDNTPLIVIVGETASGKTDLAIQLALQFNGEIIAADSRTVYIGLDISTAKPSAKEQKGIRHHLIDVVYPTSNFSAADFKQYAQQAIKDIHSRGKLPIIVGGTGLYVDALLYDFAFRPTVSAEFRRQFESLSVTEMQALIRARQLNLPTNDRNPRHLLRVLESNGAASERSPLRSNTLLMGLSVDRELLRKKLQNRVTAMIAMGLVREMEDAVREYGWLAPGLQAPAYKAFHDYFDGKISLEDAKSKFVQNDWALAKRQRTWFKRNNDIIWISKTEEAVDLVTSFLNK